MASARNDGLMRLWLETRVRFVGYALFRDLLHAGISTLGLHLIDLFVEWAIALSRVRLERGGTGITWHCQPGNVEALDFRTGSMGPV